MNPSNERSGEDDNLDKIGDWSVDKLRILKDYSEQYSAILQRQVTSKNGARRFHFGYIDAFAGAGEHVHKVTGQVVPGSPQNALGLATPFDEYHFVEQDPDRVAKLNAICAGVTGAKVHHGDCNVVLPRDIFPKFKFEDYRRALCFLDPYGLHLNWKVLETAGKMKSMEIFLNFPVMDMNRNAKRKDLSQVSAGDRARMDAFWGDDSWHKAMYAPSSQDNFFGILAGEDGNSPELEKNDNEAFAAAFQKRLKEVAGFAFVPKPIPMRNSNRAVVYYLFFAGPNETGNKIVRHIFKKYP
jgi:three-Cys-motif partner protein